MLLYINVLRLLKFKYREKKINLKCYENMKKWKHTHTHTWTQGICLGQDTANTSFSWHLLEGKSGLEAVVWHQRSKSDTINHQPLNMETFITSWQENLVENNHLGLDNNLNASFAPCLDGVLFSFTILYLQPLFIYFYVS